MKEIKIKRAYDPIEKSDGFRILVDRLWPRGISKAEAHFDLWLKEIAPSTELRNWYKHDPKKWPEFTKRYFSELHDKKELVDTILEQAKKHTVTLIYSAKEEEHNNAVALKKYLEK
jgi:uncharacterized protein YeaO (DUF488 family)